ncbi:MAG: PHB depolymerase family esterase [Novosphingobium sp.]|nr:PHB depolymerase family esterase [Novosphingobium sp.]
MPSLSETIARLSKMRALPSGAPFATPDRLTDIPNFGSNPGQLRARIYIPEGLQKDAPLVVVLHGCTQNAAAYDAGSGWSQLADRHGFALLFPEQTRANNPNLCFNWFQPDDVRRDAGEPLSIRQMIETIVAAHKIDPKRIFVTGLSAGGAMTSVMLATYPELFAGGAIIAGLPYGTAGNMPEAFDRMRGHGGAKGEALAALVRAASGHRGPWPTISIWHGTADQTVSRANAEAILAQWRPLHGLNSAPTRQDLVDGYPHRTWCDASGRALIEEYEITGLAHGTPLATRGESAVGAAGPHMLEAGISSTRHIAASWGLTDAFAGEAAQPATAPSFESAARPHAAAAHAHATGVGKVIEDALRTAGLMR